MRNKIFTRVQFIFRPKQSFKLNKFIQANLESEQDDPGNRSGRSNFVSSPFKKSQIAIFDFNLGFNFCSSRRRRLRNFLS